MYHLHTRVWTTRCIRLAAGSGRTVQIPALSMAQLHTLTGIMKHLVNEATALRAHVDADGVDGIATMQVCVCCCADALSICLCVSVVVHMLLCLCV